jgi:type IV pilus assembly protein PilB
VRTELAIEVVDEFLGSVPLFSKCDPAAVTRVVPRIAAFDYGPGATIVSAGEQTKWLGVLFRGKASVRTIDAATGVSSVMETLRVGDHFGDVGALLGTGQPFAVVAEESVTVLQVPEQVFGEFATRMPGFSHALARRLSTRLLQTSVQTVRRAPAVVGAPGLGPAPRQPTPLPPVPQAPAGVIAFVQVTDFEIGAQLLAMIPARVIQRHQIVPLKLEGNRLTVGMVNPRSSAALADLRRVLHSVDPLPVAIASEDFAQAVVRFKIADTAAADVRRPGTPGITPEALVFDQIDAEPDKAIRVAGEEVITLASRILLAGVEREASDVHLEPDGGGMKVRFRIEGTLGDWSEFVPPSFVKPLVARLKVLGGLDITEKRLPQDGRIGMRAGRRELDVRISTMPSSRGEKVVLRIFEAAAMMRPLEQIFLEPGTLAAVRKAVDRPYGGVVVAGPTGSGKSSSLYALINDRRRNRPDSSILMVEDPVEYRLQGVTQVQLRPSVGLTYPAVLRASLRQDPDVIMVGEIRDDETAKIALEAAMTGHLLFTSLHAPTAIGVLQRFENLGAARSLVAQSLALVIVQRLARRLCASCVKVEPPAPLLYETLAARGLVEPAAPVPLPRPVGCETCRGTGHLGRVAVVEALQLTDEVRSGLMSGAPLGDLERIARETGVLFTFQRSASHLMARKIIAPSEALLVVAE